MIPFRFAQLHHFCIPAYTHQIPNGISSHFLIYSRSKYAYPKMGFYKEIGGNGFKWIKLVFFPHHLINSVGFFIHNVPP